MTQRVKGIALTLILFLVYTVAKFIIWLIDQWHKWGQSHN